MCITGVCGVHTKEKQEFFAKFMEHQINVVSLIGKTSKNNPYLFYDPFGGPGHIICKESYYDGPVSSVRVAQLMNKFDLDYKIIVADNNPEYANDLQDLLLQYSDDITIYNDALLCIPDYTWQFGMMYVDPPMTKDSFLLVEELIVKTAKVTPRIDLFLYISANNIKRFRGNSSIKFSAYLQDLINKVDKKFWVIKQNVGSAQYTFLVGTNYKKWAEWGKEDFYSVNSFEGQKIMTRLNYSQKEILFNTYGIKQQGMF